MSTAPELFQLEERIDLPEGLTVVEGMEDVHSLMKEFGDMSAEYILESYTRNEGKIAIGCFLNGALGGAVPYTLAALRLRVADEDIYKKIVDKLVLMERVRGIEKNVSVTCATILNKEWEEEPEELIVLDDIAETLKTTDDMVESFPKAVSTTVLAPVIKHVTHEAHALRPNYSIKYVKEIDDEWVLSGCGMDGSVHDKSINQYRLNRLSALQRLARMGIFYSTPTNRPNADKQLALFEKLQLSWVNKLRVKGDMTIVDYLTLMDQEKKKKNYETQFQFASELLERLVRMDRVDAEMILQ